MNVDQIRKCRSLGELASLWKSHIDELSRLSKDEAKALIQAKDSHKSKLELFEEWLYWFEERSAIVEIDGGLSRKDAEGMAKDAVWRGMGVGSQVTSSSEPICLPLFASIGTQ